MDTTAQPINLTVLPDAQASRGGLTLDALLSCLQFHMAPDEYGAVPRVNFDAWTKYFEDNGLDIGRKHMYITAPLTVRLVAGVYNITTIVRIFTIADLTVTGEKGATVIRFHRYDFAGEPFIWHGAFPKGRDCVAFISSYMSDPGEPGTKPVEPGIQNSLILRDLTVRMEEGLWFPYTTVDSQGNKGEVPLGVLLSYSSFHKVELSGLDIEAGGTAR